MQLSKHRLEALTDGIYAVAMTLLVIDLRVPERHAIGAPDELIQAVADLIPQFIAWVISFFVLALFWMRHHALFHYVRSVDGPLLALSMMQLGLIGLFPFSSSLAGKFAVVLFSQVFYSINMALLAVVTLVIVRYVHRHPALCSEPMPMGAYRGARFRLLGLVMISAVAILIAMVVPAAGNAAFMLMAAVNAASRRFERQPA